MYIYTYMIYIYIYTLIYIYILHIIHKAVPENKKQLTSQKEVRFSENIDRHQLVFLTMLSMLMYSETFNLKPETVNLIYVCEMYICIFTHI